MISDIADIIKQSDRFLIVTHVNPDGDAIGSLLGMYLALKEMGKRAWALAGKRFQPLYGFLPGCEEVAIDPTEISGTPDWIISLDVAAEERISGDIRPFRGHCRLINIDHHATNPGFGDINLIEPGATCTAELVFKIVKLAGHQVSLDVGKCLYTGLITDTGCFCFSGVDSRTLRLAAEMLEAGFDSYEVSRHLYEEYPISRLALERLMLERVEILLDGRLVISTFYSDDFSRIGADFSDTDNLVNKLRASAGVEVGILITQVADGLCRVSLRSKGRLDVSDIAASLGGGGHRHAAGLKATLPIHDLKQRIVASVAKALG